ncbi:YkoP family protein [Ornithinibacillus halophilus]|uniref:YkoP-like domain-containing protein n=1 Tax=Ornithinibacillus halophilus TaxID=930117 RepID=A0A1M5N7F6_9BACI|nr:hypothetical protein [Ornithinibacillus halophilus]SHG85448.1 hypothetical protein SAMN05216225_10721 [Ornithinibacillus halophilus]
MKSYLLGVWNVIDPVYYSLTRLRYVPGEDKNSKCVFRVRLTRYKGETVKLQDGTIIQKNDILLKIHLHNVKLLKKLQAIKSDMKRAVYIYHMVKKSLPYLAKYVELHPKRPNIKGVIGITTLHKGSRQLGFEVFSIKNEFYRTYKKATFLPINMIANATKHEEPVYLFMSKQNLLERHRN